MLRLVAASIPVEYSSIRITVGFPGMIPRIREEITGSIVEILTNECNSKRQFSLIAARQFDSQPIGVLTQCCGS